MSLTIGIIGNGFVGQATSLFKNKDVNILVYDIVPEKCVPQNITLDDFTMCDLIFICVPTPMKKDSSCSLAFIHQVINNLDNVNIDYDKTDIILRSTVPIGSSKKLKVNFMPEFLTEKNWKNDFIYNKDWIIGILNKNNDALIEKFQTLFSLCYENKSLLHDNITLHFVSTREAEYCKYVRNALLAVKVSFCNEIEQYCLVKGLNYNRIRNLCILDKRFGSSHTLVPGPDGIKGYGGTCLVKDINSLLHQFNQDNYKSYIIKASIDRNQQIDRPQMDWNKDKGRAVE